MKKMRKNILLFGLLPLLFLSSCLIDDNPDLPSYCELRSIHMRESGSIVQDGQVTGQLDNDLCSDAYGTIKENGDGTKTIRVETTRLANSEATGITAGEITLTMTSESFPNGEFVFAGMGEWSLILQRNNFYVTNLDVSTINIINATDTEFSARVELSYTLTTEDNQTIDATASIEYDKVELQQTN